MTLLHGIPPPPIIPRDMLTTIDRHIVCSVKEVCGSFASPRPMIAIVDGRDDSALTATALFVCLFVCFIVPPSCSSTVACEHKVTDC
jgi:hypothetical protein